MDFPEASHRRLRSESRNGRDGKSLRVKILSSWKEYLKKGGVQLNMGIDKRLCITVPEAAEMLGISRNFAYQLVREGKLPSIRFGKRILIPRAGLERMLENGVIG